MDLLYVLQNFPKISESFILNELYELEERGHNIAIFALGKPDEEFTHEEFRDIEAEIYYPEWPTYSDLNRLIWRQLLRPTFITTLALNRGLKYRLTQAYMTREIVRFTKRLDLEPELIHTHFSTRGSLYPYSASKILGIPFSIEVHANDIFHEDRTSFSRKFLRKPGRIITVSNFNRNYLQEEFGLEKPIDVVPVSVRTQKFEPKGLEEKNKIVSVGRLVEKKGFQYGIKAFSKLKEEYPELRYKIIGEGELEQELRQLSEDLGVSEDIVFSGYVSDEELKKEMEEAKVFVLPCVKAENGDLDAMPMVLKEAMALKTPCVSTTVSAIPELIEDKEDGLLVEPRNASSMRVKLSELLQSKRQRDKMGEKARKKINEEYNISKNIEKIEAAFRKTIS
ncbi:glycosyltransferase [Nanohaloarchaea archaeon H01]|nr:glycosyltransferase [Nanohaloarchaea archaeon H01]